MDTNGLNAKKMCKHDVEVVFQAAGIRLRPLPKKLNPPMNMEMERQIAERKDIEETHKT